MIGPKTEFETECTDSPCFVTSGTVTICSYNEKVTLRLMPGFMIVSLLVICSPLQLVSML